MKKRIIYVLTAVILVMSMIAVTGCGKDKSGIVGTWQLTGWQMNGVEQSLEDYGMGDVESTMTFTEDGKVTINMSENEAEGTWVLDDDVLEVTASGCTQAGLLQDGKIYLGDKTSGYGIYEKK